MKDEYVDFLTKMVEIETPSTDYQTFDPLFELIEGFFEPLPYRVLRVKGKNSGGQLLIKPNTIHPKGMPQMMLGHVDTVWSVGTLQKMPCTVVDDRLSGPGTYDMKAGVCNMFFALKALHELEIQTACPSWILINTDEETSSQDSYEIIMECARQACRVYVLEPGLGPKGKLKTSRKGVGMYDIVVRGKSAHAGLEPERGASAILELSNVIQHLFALNQPEKGITVNVGTIDGGMRRNVVAPESRASVDVRVMSVKDAEDLDIKIKSLKALTPGVSLEVTGNIDRPPMERNEGVVQLWNLAQKVAAMMEIPIEEGLSGGGSDGNFTSQVAPTLDGLGAVGDGAHADHEHILITETLDRCALLAGMLVMES